MGTFVENSGGAKVFDVIRTFPAQSQGVTTVIGDADYMINLIKNYDVVIWGKSENTFTSGTAYAVGDSANYVWAPVKHLINLIKYFDEHAILTNGFNLLLSNSYIKIMRSKNAPYDYVVMNSVEAKLWGIKF